MEQQIIDLLAQYPKVLAALALIGTLRLVFKPIMAALDQIVVATESKKDDEVLGKVKSSKIYKGFVFVVDYVASIKLPVKK